MNNSEISSYMAQRAINYYKEHVESLDNKCRELVERYGKLDYEIIEHDIKTSIYDLDIIRLKNLIHKLHDVIIISDYNNIIYFNFSNMNLSEIKTYINNYNIFNNRDLWVKVNNGVELSILRNYFNNHIIKYMIRNNMDLPDIPYSIYKNPNKLNSFLVNTFTNDELHIASKYGIFRVLNRNS